MKGQNFSYGEKLMLFAIFFAITICLSKGITFVIDYFDLFGTFILTTALCMFTSIILIANENKMNHVISLFLFALCCVIYAVISA